MAELPECRLDGPTLLTGLKCQLLTIACGLAAALLTLPLWAIGAGDQASSADTAVAAPALIGAFQGPSYLVLTILLAVLSAVCLARFAITGSAWAGLDVVTIWSHLRAEPAIWIATAVIGFAVEETPASLAWLLPLPVSWQTPALLLATALFWPFALLVQAHLIGLAHRCSAQTLTRRPLIVRVRW
jgi:hypothetical protein